MITFAVAAPLVLATAPAARAAAPPGCGHLPGAVAHHPGGVVLSPQPSPAPEVCGVSTGFAAAESHIVVTDGGTVVYVPAVLPSGTLGTGEGPPVGSTTQGNATPAGLALSADQGATWTLVKPDGITWNPTDHGDYIDPRTGRFFFEDYGPIPLAPQLGADQEGPAYLLSTDNFTSWTRAVIPDVALPENPHFTSGPAPSGQPAAAGYPDVLYFCANTNVGFTSPAIAARLCFRSLDGGATWAQRSVLLSSSAPRHPECGTSGETFSAVDGYYPQPAPDGSLYVLVACGGRTYLARSTDEAATFPVVHTGAGPVQVPAPVDSITALGSGPQLRIDPQGNFYLVAPVLGGSSITGLVLRVSRDRGATWSAPVDVAAPGVTGILRWAVAERGNAELALGYLAQRQGQTTWDAYVTETSDPLAPTPLMWSAITSTQPLLFTNRIEGAGDIVGQGEVAVPYPFPLGIQPIGGAVSAGNDFMGVAIGSDGSVWASFDRDCGPSPSSPGCVADNDQTRGFVGRLIVAGAAVATPAPAPGPQTGLPGGLPATGGSPAVPAVGVALAAVSIGVLAARRRGRLRESPRSRIAPDRRTV